MEVRNLSDIRTYLHTKLGLEFTINREKELYTKLTSAAKGFGFENTDIFIDWLVTQPLDETQSKKLAEYLTIGETYFFREKKALDFLEFKFLPGLIAQRKGKRQRIKIWSAGCSSGEEPYSIAILLNRLLPDFEKWNITILATDINPNVLEKAKSGIYTKWSFRKTPEKFQTQYFEKTDTNKFEIKDWIKKRVTFKFLNLVSDDFPSVNKDMYDFDVILCRNVLIYFSQEGIKNIISKFFRTLKNNGVFLVSPVEASSVLASEFSRFSYEGATIFQKGIVKNEKTKMPIFSTPVKRKQLAENLHKKVSKKNGERKEIKASQNNSSVYFNHFLNLNKEKTEAIKLPETNAKNSSFENVRELANKGKLQEAEKLCLGFVAKNRVNDAAYYLLATIYYEQGKTQEAIKLLNQTLFLNPDFVLAHFLLGEICLKENKPESSRYLKNALNCISKLKPDDLIEGSDGITAANLKEVILSIM